MKFYLDVFKAFEKAEVKYLIVGGVAVSLYGIPRMTQDLDVIIALDEVNVHKTVVALDSIGYKPRVPVVPELLAKPEIRKEWEEQKNMLVFSFFRGEKEYRVVDILFAHSLDFDDCFKRRSVVFYESIPLPVLQVDDLILLKRQANREQDVSDVYFLERHGRNNEHEQ